MALFETQLKQRRQIYFLRFSRAPLARGGNSFPLNVAMCLPRFHQLAGLATIENFEANCCASKTRDFDCWHFNVFGVRYSVSLPRLELVWSCACDSRVDDFDYTKNLQVTHAVTWWHRLCITHRTAREAQSQKQQSDCQGVVAWNLRWTLALPTNSQ